jgi:hypothetical protein
MGKINNYSKYIEFIYKLYDSYNEKVKEVDIPPYWKVNLFLDKNKILTEQQFLIRINKNDEFSKKWK